MDSISLPWPDPILSSNSRPHWRVKASATSAARSLAWIAAREASISSEGDISGISSEGDIPVTITFYPPSRRWDRSGMPHLVKAHLDGVADALGVNDRRFVPTYIYADPVKGGRVEIALNESGPTGECNT